MVLRSVSVGIVKLENLCDQFGIGVGDGGAYGGYTRMSCLVS